MSSDPPTDPGVRISTFKQWLLSMTSSPYLQHGLIVLGLALFAFSLVGMVSLQATSHVERMGLLHAPTIGTFDCAKSCAALPEASGVACARIGAQTAEIIGRTQFYYAALKYYTSAQFAFVIGGYTMGVVSALLGVAVSRDGWGDCDKRLLTAFGTAAALTALLQGLPALVLFQENIKQNSDTYLYYDDLLAEVETFCTTGVAKDGSTDPLPFVLYVDARVAELNELYFGVDEAQMTSGGKKFIESQNLDNYKPDAKTAETAEEPIP